MSFYFEAFSVSYPQCAGGGPGQSGDRTCLVLKISRQLSVKGMSVQADGNSWKGRARHITSLLYSTNTFDLLIGGGATVCTLLIRNGKCLEIK